MVETKRVENEKGQGAAMRRLHRYVRCTPSVRINHVREAGAVGPRPRKVKNKVTWNMNLLLYEEK